MGDGVRKYEDLVAKGSLQGLQWGKVQPQHLLLSASVSLQGRGDAESSHLQKSTWRLTDNRTPVLFHLWLSSLGTALHCFPVILPTAD